jgi:DNA-binding CsgD family transcriptional regulator
MGSELLGQSEHPEGMARLSDLIGAIAGETFCAQLARTSADIVPCDLRAVFLYDGDGAPVCLFDDFDESEGARGLTNYVSKTYRLNPFYGAHTTGIRPGIYRIGELVPSEGNSPFPPGDLPVALAPEEEIGYVTEGWPRGMTELTVAIPIRPGITCEVCLLREAHRAFGDDDIAALGSVYPAIAAAVERHWQLRPEPGRSLGPAPRTQAAAAREDPLAVLTPRELQIVAMITEGYSSEAIRRWLDISIETVKTHRKRAYAKLGISSQAELFSLVFASALMATPGTRRPC